MANTIKVIERSFSSAEEEEKFLNGLYQTGHKLITAKQTVIAFSSDYKVKFYLEHNAD